MAKMSSNRKQLLEGAEETIARAKSASSKQPRFIMSADDKRTFFQNIYGLSKEAIFNEPPYVPDSRKRDIWLSKVVRKEPYLLGVLQSVVSIDKNRGWTIIGGKIQVNKYVGILHGFQAAPDLYGWRNSISMSAESFYRSDLGAVVETGRTQKNGPLAALYTVDPTKCKLTGDIEYPLKYSTANNDKADWEPMDYFRVSSFPTVAENMNGLGFCAVSRCLEIAKLVVSVFEHYREQLGSKAPKGILTIQGVSLDQWLASLEESTDALKELEREYYSGVQVLASENPISVNLTSLSNLPNQFEYDTFVSLAMYGYALAFGYDPREFWPVSGGTLGTGKETESQHRKATSKGGLDFALGFQEKMQEELPPTLEYEFEQRDVEGDILEKQLRQSELNIVEDLFTKANSVGEALTSRDEARQLLVDAKLIPEEWTIPEEEVEIADTDDAGDVLEKQRVRNAIERFPEQDIVIYSSRGNRYRTLLKAGEKKIATRVRALRKKKERASSSYGAIREQYRYTTFGIISDYLTYGGSISSPKSTMRQNVQEAFSLTVDSGYVDGGSELPLDTDTSDWLSSAMSSEFGYVDALFSSLRQVLKQDDYDATVIANTHAEAYASTLDGIYNTAVLYGSKNKMLTFAGDDGVESCASCQQLKGQRHKASWWIAYDYVPPTGGGLDCSGGGRCEHGLMDDDGNWVTV
jgi:hypothetical protein